MEKEKKNNDLTSISELGEFKLIEEITKTFEIVNDSTDLGVGDDAAVLDFKKDKVLVSTDMLVEGVHFDLAYTPLKHLGYKAVISNLSDIFAMNGICSQITVSIALSNRFTLESVEELYLGIRAACKKFKIDLVGGDTTSSNKGLIISITAIGDTINKTITKRTGAKENDLLVVSGDLGSAYMGLQILKRENEVFKVNPQNQPDLSSYAYLLQRQLKPEARKDVIDFFAEKNILPTSMIDISDGLSSEILHICKNSNVGCNIYEEKIPVSEELKAACEEFKLHPTTIAMSGGEDYELLFTINQKDYDKIKESNDLTVIGHITKDAKEVNLITKAEQTVPITSQGWKSF
ncbi:thiamine-phosphate kinase [Flavobacteriaceae bacterium]|nr:thiamine-phosphate kinase [Flavobacteriaceae bacterium]